MALDLNAAANRMTSDHYIHAKPRGAATLRAIAAPGAPTHGGVARAQRMGERVRCQCPDESFSPTSPATISTALNTRAADSASPMNTMPKMNAPTAPMPVQTA